MRYFIVMSNSVDTSKPLALNSITAYGRLDVICRCITSAFYLSNEFRRDVTLNIYFRINKQVLEITGNTARGFNPDERAIAGVLRRVFKGDKWPGVRMYSCDIEPFLMKNNPVMLISEGDHTISHIRDHNCYLIGDHIGFLEEDHQVLSKLEKVSLGSRVYLSSQTITILNYLLDNI